jgi:AcrR family transcriptional regulator
MSGQTEARPYSGVAKQERVAQRRARMLEAGLEVFGTIGYAKSSVRTICDAADLNQRYFYESFRSREELLEATLEWVLGELLAQVTRGVLAVDGVEERVRAGLRAWWYGLAADPRKARLIVLEIRGVSEQVEQRRRELKLAFSQFVADQATALLGPPPADSKFDLVLVARGFTAANFDLVEDWMRGDAERDIDGLIEHVVGMFLAAGGLVYPELRPV